MKTDRTPTWNRTSVSIAVKLCIETWNQPRVLARYMSYWDQQRNAIRKEAHRAAR